MWHLANLELLVQYKQQQLTAEAERERLLALRKNGLAESSARRKFRLVLRPRRQCGRSGLSTDQPCAGRPSPDLSS
jgi:hypothetical protein